MASLLVHLFITVAICRHVLLLNTTPNDSSCESTKILALTKIDKREDFCILHATILKPESMLVYPNGSCQLFNLCSRLVGDRKFARYRRLRTKMQTSPCSETILCDVYALEGSTETTDAAIIDSINNLVNSLIDNVIDGLPVERVINVFKT